MPPATRPTVFESCQVPRSTSPVGETCAMAQKLTWLWQRCLHGHSVVLDHKCEPELTEGVSAYLRDLPHARQVMRATRPTPAETTTPLDTAMTKHRREVV